MRLIERARRAANAHPRWATQLSAAKIVLLSLFLAPAWITPSIMENSMTTAKAAGFQEFSMVMASALTALFVLRTGFDIWAYRNPRRATDLKYEAISTALVAISTVATFVVLGVVMIWAYRVPYKVSIFARAGRFARART